MALKNGSLAKGLSLSIFLAGPIFLAMLGVYEAYLRFPGAIAIPWEKLIPFALMVAPLAAVFGAIISLPAHLVGGWTMRYLSNRFDWLRLPLAWAVAGGLMGIAIALIFSRAHPQPAFALIATSTVCARICRIWVQWADEKRFVSPWAKRN